MKRVLASALWAGLIAGCFFASRAGYAKGSSGRANHTVASVRDALIQVEHAWGNALLKRDVAGFGRCLGDEWVLITSDGSRVTKPMSI